MGRLRYGTEGAAVTLSFATGVTDGGEYLWSASINLGPDFPTSGWLSLQPTVASAAGTQTAQIYIAPVLDGNHVGELSDTASAGQTTDPDVGHMWHIGEIPTTTAASGEWYAFCLTAFEQTVNTGEMFPLILPRQWQVVALNNMNAGATLVLSGVFVPLAIRQA